MGMSYDATLSGLIRPKHGTQGSSQARNPGLHDAIPLGLSRRFSAPSQANGIEKSVALDSNPQAIANIPNFKTYDALPTGSRRYSRLEVCATTGPLPR